MYRQSFYPTVDARLQSVHSDYATALAGGTLSIDSTSPYCSLGQRPMNGYTVWEGCLRFDTSSIPDDAVITDAKLFIGAYANYTGNLVVVRCYEADFDSAIGTEDWVNPTSLAASPVLASFDTTSGGWVTYPEQLTFTVTDALKSAINKTGYTDIRIVTDREVAGIPPTASNEYLTMKTVEYGNLGSPLLVVTWSLPAEAGVTERNLIDNPRFANNVTDGWSLASSNITATRETSPGVDLPPPATACAKLTASSTSSAYFQSNDNLYPADAGTSYAARLDLYWPGSTGYAVGLYITWLDRNQEYVSTNAATYTEHTSSFQTVTIGPLTAPADAMYAYFKVGAHSGSGAWSDSAGNCPRITNVRFDASSTSLSSYFDGDTPACGWLGTPHNSVSGKFSNRITRGAFAVREESCARMVEMVDVMRVEEDARRGEGW